MAGIITETADHVRMRRAKHDRVRKIRAVSGRNEQPGGAMDDLFGKPADARSDHGKPRSESMADNAGLGRTKIRENDDIGIGEKKT